MSGNQGDITALYKVCNHKSEVFFNVIINSLIIFLEKSFYGSSMRNVKQQTYWWSREEIDRSIKTVLQVDCEISFKFFDQFSIYHYLPDYPEGLLLRSG